MTSPFHLKIKIPVGSEEQGLQYRQAVETVLKDYFPLLFQQPDKPKFEVKKNRYHNPLTQFTFGHTTDPALRRIVLTHKNPSRVRGYILPTEDYVKALEIASCPFVVFKLPSGYHCWAYSQKPFSEKMELANGIMDALAKELSKALAIDGIQAVASGYLLSDGVTIAGSKAPTPLKYDAVPSVEFTLRGWDSKIIKYRAANMVSIASLKGW